MLNQAFDDNATIRASKMPSSLVEVPRINERYETRSHAPNPNQIQGRDLRTLELVANMKNDPTLNINAAFFGTSS